LFSISLVLDVRRDLFCDLINLFFNEKVVPSSTSPSWLDLLEKRRQNGLKDMVLDLAGG
jgi:hypothetical protein